jgi:hypothetical protein
METQYWYSPQEYGGSLMFQFNDPYYVAPAAFFDFLYLTVTDNNLAVEMDVTDVSSGWTGTLYNQTTLETITIPETFVETTLNYADLSNGDWVFTATASDGVEYTSNTVNINYTPPPPEPDESQKRIVPTGGGWVGKYEYLYFSTTAEGRYYYDVVSKGKTTLIDSSYAIEYDPSDGMFHDKGSNIPYQWGIDNTGTNLSNFPTTDPNMQTHYWYNNAGDELKFQFDNPFYVAPPVPDENQKRLVPTAGSWANTHEYYYFETTTEGRFLYSRVTKNTKSKQDGYDVEYEPSSGIFHDVGSDNPYTWGIDNTGTNLSNFPTTDPNMQTHYWYGDTLYFQFDNPYYVAPSYRYLAFYGETDIDPFFQELELTLGTPLNDLNEIKYGVNDTGITFYESKAWDYNYNRFSTIMNGNYNWADPHLQYVNVENTNAIFWYMDLGTGVAADVNGGTFWTYINSAYSFTLGKLYGTNTDPATFTDASLIENYDFVCDLNRQTAE